MEVDGISKRAMLVCVDKRYLDYDIYHNFERPIEIPVLKIAYTYLKSIYCDKWNYRRVNKLIAAEDLLSIGHKSWNGDKHEYETTEVWNSLDETCKGNV